MNIKVTIRISRFDVVLIETITVAAAAGQYGAIWDQVQANIAAKFGSLDYRIESVELLP